MRAFGWHADWVYTKIASLILDALLAGVAYVLGFITQEVLSLCPYFSTALYVKPGPFLRRLYKWHTREESEESRILEFDIFKAYVILGKLKEKGDATRSLIERTATLKHLGSSIGPCFVAAGIISLFPCFWGGMALMIFGIVLIIHGRLKAMQQIRYLEKASLLIG